MIGVPGVAQRRRPIRPIKQGVSLAHLHVATLRAVHARSNVRCRCRRRALPGISTALREPGPSRAVRCDSETNKLVATMGIGFKGIREAFTTTVLLRPE